MNKIKKIMMQVVKENLNLKTFIYMVFVFLSSLIFFFLFSNNSDSSDLRVLNSVYSGVFLNIGLLWIVGIPFLVYASFFLAKSISKEINLGTILLVLTRPIKRNEFVLGKFLGFFVLFNFINGVLLFLFPPIVNLFGVPSIFIFPLFKVSVGIMAYSLAFTFIFCSFGIFLSVNMKNSLLSLLSLFLLILGSFLFPLICNSIFNLNFSLLKPLYPIIGLFKIPLTFNLIEILNLIFNSYWANSSFLIENFSSFFLLIIISVILPIFLIFLAIHFFNRQDIT